MKNPVEKTIRSPARCLPALSLVLFLIPAAALAGDATERIDRAVAAHGGIESIQKAESLGIRTGTFTQHFPVANSGTFVEWRKGDKMLMELKLGGLEVAQGYDGSRAWLRSLGQVIDAPHQVQSAIEQGLRHSPLLLLSAGDEGYLVTEAGPDSSLDGAPLHGVKVTPPGGLPPTSFFFDPEAWTIGKISYTDTNPYQGGEAYFESYVLGYMETDGVLFPSRTVHLIDGVKMNEVEYDSVDFRAKIPDEIFLKPSEDRADPPDDGGLRVQVPLEYSLNLLFLDVSIGGNDKRHSFILDTGAGLTCLSRELAGEIDLQATGGMSAAGAGGALDATTGRLEEISIEGLAVRDLDVMVIDIAPLAEMMGRTIDGIIGYNVLNRYSTTIDISGESLIFESSEAPLPAGEGVVEVPFQVFMGIPVVEGVVDGKEKLDFLIDTGATMSVLPKAVAQRLEPDQHLEGAVAAGADSRQMEMAVARFDDLAIGGAVADDPVLSYPLSVEKLDPLGASIDTANRGVIGTEILKSFAVTINYDTAKMALKPVKAQAESLKWCGPGLAVFMDAGDVVVRSVFKGGPADGRLESGDRILEIDGKPVEGVDLDEIVGMLRGEPGTEVEILVESESGKKTVRLQRKKLL